MSLVLGIFVLPICSLTTPWNTTHISLSKIFHLRVSVQSDGYFTGLLRLVAQMEETLFDGRDPVPILTFLLTYQSVCDCRKSLDSTALWLFEKFMENAQAVTLSAWHALSSITIETNAYDAYDRRGLYVEVVKFHKKVMKEMKQFSKSL